MSIIHQLNTALQEDSFSASDVPKQFRVAIEVFGKYGTKNKYGRHAVQLARGELKGVKGISGGKDIILSFFGSGRDTLLVMPGPQLIRMNKISRIMYKNPHYLLQDDCAALKRIYDNRSTAACLRRVMDNFHGEANKRFPMVYPSKGYMSVGQSVEYAFSLRGNSEMRVDNLRDAVRWVKTGLKRVVKEEKGREFGNYRNYQEILDGLGDNDWKSLFEFGLRETGRVYKSEAEWVLKESTLKIPTGSRLYVVSHKYKPDVEKAYQQWIEAGSPSSERGLPPGSEARMMMFGMKHSWFYRHRVETTIKRLGLNRKYKLVRVTQERLDQLKKQVWSARGSGD
jgi:hypothetical protein